MRKILFFVFALSIVAGNLFAQQDTVHHLIQLNKLNALGLYVAPEYQYGQLNGEFTPMAGGSAMLMFNNRFAVGVTGQYSFNESFAPKGVAPLALQAGYAGVKMEYTVRPSSAVHVTFPLVIGMGGARADSIGTDGRFEHNHDENDSTDVYEMHDRGGMRGEYFIIQPGVQVEANLFKYAKVFAGVNYRIAPKFGSETTTLPTNTLSGVSINVGLKVGLFDYYFRKNKNMEL